MLFDAQPILQPDDARARIGKLIGADNLRRAEQSTLVDQDLARDVDLFVSLGAGPVPKLLVGGTKVDGLPPSKQRLFELIEKEFHIWPVRK
jgi:hypothetical protein